MQKVINSVTIDMASQLVDTIIEVIQGPCKENQKTLVVHNKIIDTCREFINKLSKHEELELLGFIQSSCEDDEESGQMIVMENVDEFISKIATMLVSLLEGEKDLEILAKMSFSITMDDMKDRLLNVFGVFLQQHKIFPAHLLDASIG